MVEWCRGHPLAILAVLFLAAVLNPIQPQSEERASGMNPLVLSKLAVAGAATALGCWGLLNSQRIRRALVSVPGALLASLAMVLLVTSAFAIEDSATIARASSLIFGGYIAFVLTSSATVDLHRLTLAMSIGCLFFLLVTWALFLLVPSVGVFMEYTGNADTVARMGGTNHPNAIGREAVVALMLCIAMLRPGTLRESRPLVRVLLYFVALLALATMVPTYSRTSIMAGVLAVGAMLFDQLWNRLGAVLAGSLIVVGLVAVLVVGVLSQSDAEDSVLSAVTKSGDAEELTSFTGRTTIWAEAIDWIRQRPWTGYGLDSAASVMSKEATGTHNLLLYITFSGGVIAGLILIGLLILTGYHAVSSQVPLFRGVATYVLISGLVEDTLIESFPAMLTLLWILMLLSPSFRQTRPVVKPL